MLKKENLYITSLANSLPHTMQEPFRTIIKQRRINPWTVLVLAIFLPFIAADRFLLGHRSLAIFKIIYLPIAYGISITAIKIIKSMQSFMFNGMFSTPSYNDNTALLYLLYLVPYVWIVADAILAIPNTIGINKRTIDDVYFHFLGTMHNKKNNTAPQKEVTPAIETTANKNTANHNNTSEQNILTGDKKQENHLPPNENERYNLSRNKNNNTYK